LETFGDKKDHVIRKIS